MCEGSGRGGGRWMEGDPRTSPLATSCAGDAVPTVQRRLKPDGPDFDRLQ